MGSKRNWLNVLPGAIVALFLGLLYFRTMAPGLTWAFDGADGGDLTTAAAIGGVPHPTGYPTYLIAASGFLSVPIGSLAFRANLLSLVAAVAAGLLLYALMIALGYGVFSAAVTCLVFGTTPLIWSQAIITEVYTLQAFLTVVFLYILLVIRPRTLSDLALGLAAGITLGNHLTGILLLPLLLISRNVSNGSDGIGARFTLRMLIVSVPSLLRRILGILIGMSVYLVIPIRAHSQAPVNWGNVHDLQSFIWLASGKMYWARLTQNTSTYLYTGFSAWSHFMLAQFTVFGLLLLLFGSVVLFKVSPHYLAATWIASAYSIFAIVFYSPDSYALLTPAIISFSIWIGLASQWIYEQTGTMFSHLNPIPAILILSFFLLRGLFSVHQMDLSKDSHAEEYAKSVLNSAPPDAILLVQGDEATFPLWYFQYANHQRGDVAVVSSDLLFEPWYHDVLRYTYPHLVIPDIPWDQSLILANPRRPACHAGPGLKPQLECSS